MTTLTAVNGPFSCGPRHGLAAPSGPRVAVVCRVAATVVAVDAGARETGDALDGRDEPTRLHVKPGRHVPSPDRRVRYEPS